MSKEIIQFDQAMFESKLDAMVREKVTELLNAMPDASGGRDRQRREIRAFRRTEGVPGRPLLYFVKLRWTCSALNLDTVGVQLEHRRRLVPCVVVCLVYFMRECLFR